ncbi:MAG: heme ABC exporter ATP-binding protein CcmA [Proteobacteria bacterium]|nr:heme ABC exporter ATP-binding protein CcmA [Pseudomonadota bacterium]
MNTKSRNSSTSGDPSSSLLRIEGISKEFGYKAVLKKIDLSLRERELTLLLGKNGAGKSTLMKIVAGLIRPSQGKIYFEGEDISKRPESLRKSIGVISHNVAFYGDLSARENLLFFAKFRRIDEVRDKVEHALKQTGLERFTDIPIKTFSSGMYKRLNIARLMVFEPRILLLDEPYSGLDYDSTDFFNKYLIRFKNQGGTVLMISHQIETCFEVCDNVAVLEQGEIQNCYQARSYTCEGLIREYQNLTQGKL